jgi:hypothetical protein
VTQGNSLAGLLSIPTQQTPKDEVFDTRPKQMQQWVDALPRANVGETSRLIYQALYKINRQDVADHIRYKTLELFREPVNYISETIKKHYIGLPFPLPEKKRKIAVLGRELHAEMAIGYKIIIKNKMLGASSRIDNKTFISSVHRAIWYLSNVLIRSYQMYTPVPKNDWKELHRLYQYAQVNEFHVDVVKNQVGEQSHDSDIITLYKQIVLLALASPYCLRQTHIEKIYAALGDWSTYTDLTPIMDPTRLSGLYVIDLSSDNPPGFFSTTGAEEFGHYLLVDTNRLIGKLRDIIIQQKDSHKNAEISEPTGLSRDVLKRLVLSWRGLSKRHFSRTQSNNQVLVALGLRAAHHFIYQKVVQKLEEETQPVLEEGEIKEDGPWVQLVKGTSNNNEQNKSPKAFDESVFNDRSNFRAKPIYNATQPVGRSRDVWDPFYNKDIPDHGEYNLNFFNPNDTGAFTIDNSQVDYETHVCRSVNESAGGFCLLWMPWESEAGEDPSSINALVGELIGIQDVIGSEESEWAIGVIRWMKNTHSKQLELGVQKLAPFALAAGTRYDEQDMQSGDYQRSLLLPELKAVNQPKTILTSGQHRIGTVLKLSVFGEKKYIKLKRLMEYTGAYARYEYEELKQKVKPSPRKETDESGLDFDSIWSSI